MARVTPTTSPFRFKRFEIHQSRAAMKVGFDGILLGAWASAGNCQRIMDIGTGTGLIAIMLAQRTEWKEPRAARHIDAIEIDPASCRDAEDNVARSPWYDRIDVVRASIQDLAATCPWRYGLITCNPPYFKQGVASPDPSRSTARQEVRLTLAALFDIAHRLLNPDGRFGLIVPADRHETCLDLGSARGLFCRRRLFVKSLPHKRPHRVLLEFQFQGGATDQNELAVERVHHEYTDEFKSLTRDFYLRF